MRVFSNDGFTLNSPGLAFIALVFKTSRGCVMVVAMAPFNLGYEIKVVKKLFNLDELKALQLRWRQLNV